MVVNMERAIEKQLFKKSNANRYLLTLVIGAILFLLLSIVYIYSARLAAITKYGIFDYEEAVSAEGDLYYQILGLTQFMYQIPIVLFFIYVLRKDLKEDFIDFRLEKKRNLSIILIGVVSILVLTILINVVYTLLGIEDTSDNQEIIESSLIGSSGIFMAISVVILAPFVEEMLFRKCLCDTFKYKFNVPDIVTIILSALVFSLMHITDLSNLIFIFQYVPLALIIVLSYYFSKNIYVPIAIHFINNFAGVIISYVLYYGGLI